MNDTDVWAEPCTAMLFSNCDSDCRERTPYTLSHGGGGLGMKRLQMLATCYMFDPNNGGSKCSKGELILYILYLQLCVALCRNLKRFS